jgi:hypothetical protein
LCEEDKVQDYLRKLDPYRFGLFRQKLIDTVHFGSGKYPATLNATVDLVSTYIQGNNMNSNADANVKKVDTVFVTKAEAKKEKSKGKKQVVEADEPVVVSNNGNENWLSTIKCHNCNKMGHFARDCDLPDRRKNKKSGHVSVIEVTIKNESIILYEQLSKENSSNKNYILLDSCASVPLFHNKELLKNIRKSKYTYQIKGITKHCLEVDEEGDLDDFGVVLYHPKALANVVSLSTMSDNPTLDIQFDKSFGFTVYTLENALTEKLPNFTKFW